MTALYGELDNISKEYVAPMSQRARFAFEKVLVLGETDSDTPLADLLTELWKGVSTKHLDENRLMRLTATFLYGFLPNGVKEGIKKDQFDFAPVVSLVNDDDDSFHIGSGGTNSVYKVHFHHLKKDYALLFHRPWFPDKKTAIEHAIFQKNELARYQQIYAPVLGEDFIPNEDYVVYTAHNGSVNVMCVKEFIPGEIEDPFFDYNETELTKLLQKYPDLSSKILLFVETTINNRNYLLDKVENLIDICGKRNLCIVWKDIVPTLVFLDPHSMCTIEDPREKVSSRLVYLKRVCQKASMN